MPSFTTSPTGPTVPATLKVQAGDTPITVIVATTTKIVGGYGGRSSLDEFAPKDRISAQGSFETSKPGSTTRIFNARWIKDWTIQRAYTRVVGRVLSVSKSSPPNSLTLQVARGGSRHSPYQPNQQVAVDLTSATLKIVWGSVPVKVDALHQDMRIVVMGVYRTQSTLRATRVRILGTPGRSHPVATPTPTPKP
jgi:hypothetical protein